MRHAARQLRSWLIFDVRQKMKTLAKCFCGFVLGWVIYMVAMVLTVYDGGLSLIFQPIMAALFSGVFVVAAFVIGLPLRAPKIRDAWSCVGWWALLISVAAIGVLIFHSKLGLEVDGVDPETKESMKMISPVAGVVAYLFAIFPIVNLPAKKEPNKAPEPTPTAVTPRAIE
jgi:uncharacterized membrane protein YhaH (DUF805 family)